MAEPTATYQADFDNKPVDVVRFLVGDTNVEKPQLYDDEVQFLIDSHGEGYPAAVAAAEALAAKYTREIDFSTGKLRRAESTMASRFRELAAQLRRQMLTQIAPYVGGLSKDEATADQEDTDLRQPEFYRDMFHNRRAPADPGGGVDDSESR